MTKFSRYPSLKALEVYNWKIHKQAGAELCQAQSKLELVWLLSDLCLLLIYSK